MKHFVTAFPKPTLVCHPLICLSLSLSNSLILMTTVVIAVAEYATLNRIVARPTNLRPVNGGIFVIHAPISAKVAEYNHCCRFGW